jgi:hypothetical protein
MGSALSTESLPADVDVNLAKQLLEEHFPEDRIKQDECLTGILQGVANEAEADSVKEMQVVRVRQIMSRGMQQQRMTPGSCSVDEFIVDTLGGGIVHEAASPVKEEVVQAIGQTPVALNVTQHYVPEQTFGADRKQAFSIRECVGPAACVSLVRMSEESGYEPQCEDNEGCIVLPREFNKAWRCIIHAPTVAAALWQRVRHAVPQVRAGADGGEWRAVGLNERLRFLKYHPGMSFAPHTDNRFRKDGMKTFTTALLYLGAEGIDFSGGATRFCCTGYDDSAPRTARQDFSFHPAAGDVLAFDHEVLHAGDAVTKGVKYVVRTDVMYARANRRSVGL